MNVMVAVVCVVVWCAVSMLVSFVVGKAVGCSQATEARYRYREEPPAGVGREASSA